MLRLRPGPPGERPDLAIEVEWSSRRLDKLEALERSAFLPDLDLALLVSFLDRPTAFDAIRDFTRALGAPR